MLSDSWAVRRRASEGLLKTAGRAGEVGDSPPDTKASGIKEEEEERADVQLGASASAAGNGPQESPNIAAVPATDHQAPPEQGRANAGGAVPTLTLNTRVQNQGAAGGVVGTPVEQTPAGPPPGIMDVNSIEWQYLDPQGQIQGACATIDVRLGSLNAHSQGHSRPRRCKSGMMTDTLCLRCS